MSVRVTTEWSAGRRRSRAGTVRALTLRCDGCGAELAGAPGRLLGLVKTAEAAGWLVGAPEDYCPACRAGPGPGPGNANRPGTLRR